jgi:hypothetical protein
MDMNNLAPVEIWLQSLGLLYKACEPLTFDCLRTEEEQSLLMKDITDHTYYCACVKRDVERGKKSESWDEWNSDVETVNVMVSKDDRQGFGDLLTKIFDGES